MEEIIYSSNEDEELSWMELLEKILTTLFLKLKYLG